MKRAATAHWLLCCVLASAAFEASAQPQEKYQLRAGSRQPSADELQVIELMKRSADASDHDRPAQADALGEQALALARKTRFREPQAMALLHMATLAQHRGEHDRALQLLNQSLLLCEIEGSLACQANARLLMAESHALLGQPVEADHQTQMSRKLAQAAGYAGGKLNADVQQMARADSLEQKNQLAQSVLSQAQASGATIDEAVALRTLGREALEAGDYARAQSMFDQALARSRSAKHFRTEVDSLVALAELAIAQRQFVRARILLEQASAAATQSGDQGGLGNALLKASTVYLLTRDMEKALDTASRALAAFSADGQLLGQGLAHQAIGDAQWMQGRRAKAEPSYREAIRLSAAAGGAINEAGARLRLATLLRAVDTHSAMAQAEQAMALYQRAGLKSGIANALLEQAWIDGAGKNYAGSIDKALKSRVLFEPLYRPERLARVDYTLSIGWRMREQFDPAAAAAERAVSAYRRLGMGIEEADALHEQAEILRRQDKTNEADVALVRAQSLVPADSVNLSRILVLHSIVQDALGHDYSARQLAAESVAAARHAGDDAQIRAARQWAERLATKEKR